MSSVIKIKKSTLSTIFWILLGISVIYWLFGSTDITENTTTFLFESEDGQRFDGKVYINDILLGDTEDGEIDVARQIRLTDEVTFEGVYNSEKFVFYYEFEKEDLSLSEIPFPITEEDIIDYQKRGEDNFPNITRLHWGHMPVTYKIFEGCSERQNNLTRSAFDRITSETEGMISFAETNEYEDISIYCEPQKIDTRTGEGAIAEALPIPHPDNENLVMYGDIYIYGQGQVCITGYPALEVHEILHLFGMPHNPFLSSVMAQYALDTNSCKVNKIDKEYISCLKYIYSNGQFNGSCEFPSVVYD